MRRHKFLVAMVVLVFVMVATASAANEEMSYTSDGRLRTWVNSYSSERYIWVELNGDEASVRIESPDAPPTFNMNVYLSLKTGKNETSKYENVVYDRYPNAITGKKYTIDLTPYRNTVGELGFGWSPAFDIDAGPTTFGSSVQIEYINGEWGIKLREQKRYDLLKLFWAGDTDPLHTSYWMNETEKAEWSPVLAEIKASLPANHTDYELLRAIHIWVTKNFWYYKSAPSNLPENLRSHMYIGACDYYSNAVSFLCTLANIPVLQGSYTPAIGEGHAWNFAYADNHWLILDTTWDLRITLEYDDVITYPASELEDIPLNHFDMSLEYIAVGMPKLHGTKTRPHTFPAVTYTAEAVDIKPSAASLQMGAKNPGPNYFPPIAESYQIEGNNYLKLRDIAMFLKGTSKEFSIDWDGVAKSISVKTNQAYIPVGGELSLTDYMQFDGFKPSKAEPNKSPLYINGIQSNLRSYTVVKGQLAGGNADQWWQTIGNNYYRLRDVAKVLNFYVGWDGSTERIIVDLNRPYTDN